MEEEEEDNKKTNLSSGSIIAEEFKTALVEKVSVFFKPSRSSLQELVLCSGVLCSSEF